ncbi:MAG: hypothetical protein Q9167_005385 [Letrouitia subvulpina]
MVDPGRLCERRNFQDDRRLTSRIDMESSFEDLVKVLNQPPRPQFQLPILKVCTAILAVDRFIVNDKDLDNVSLDLDPFLSDDGILPGAYEASMAPQTNEILPDSDALFNFDAQDVFGPNVGEFWQTPHAATQFTNEKLFEGQNSTFHQGYLQDTNTFPLNQTWTCDPALLTTSPNISSSVGLGAGNQMQKQEPRNCTTMVPYDVEPETLDTMFNAAYKSRTKMAMETYH